MPGGVDAAFATQPGTAADCVKVMRDQGHIVAISGDTTAPKRGIIVDQLPHTGAVQAELQQLLAEVSSKTIHLEIEQVYSFKDASLTLAKARTRHAKGKIVLDLSLATHIRR